MEPAHANQDMHAPYKEQKCSAAERIVGVRGSVRNCGAEKLWKWGNRTSRAAN
jgi:hypothetical protein